MGLELFKVHVASQDTVKEKAVDGILCLIESERYDRRKNRDSDVHKKNCHYYILKKN